MFKLEYITRYKTLFKDHILNAIHVRYDTIIYYIGAYVCLINSLCDYMLMVYIPSIIYTLLYAPPYMYYVIYTLPYMCIAYTYPRCIYPPVIVIALYVTPLYT